MGIFEHELFGQRQGSHVDLVLQTVTGHSRDEKVLSWQRNLLWVLSAEQTLSDDEMLNHPGRWAFDAAIDIGYDPVTYTPFAGVLASELKSSQIFGRLLTPRKGMFGAAQMPNRIFKPNVGGARTLAEAETIARQAGIHIADDVEWMVVPDELFAQQYGNASATYGRQLSGNRYTTRTWRDLLENKKMVVRIRASVLDSDEAIVSVFNHEMYEVNHWRKRLANGRTVSFDEWRGEVRTGSPHNLHCEAWDSSNDLTDRLFGAPNE